MSEKIYAVSVVILWGCIALNTWAMIRSHKLSHEYISAIAALAKAKADCDRVARKLNTALDHVQNGSVGAALAAMEEEAAE